MVLLAQDIPLSWEETEKLSKYFNDLCVKQFIDVYHKWKNRNGDEFKWGDEVNYLNIPINDTIPFV